MSGPAGIEDRLGDAGYTLLTVNTDDEPERERSQLEALRARHVDGLISATARLTGLGPGAPARCCSSRR